MKNFESWIWSNIYKEEEDKINIEEIFSEKDVKSAFEKVGYNAFDIDIYDNKIIAAPTSNEMDGSFSKNFCKNIHTISEILQSDNFDFSDNFKIRFYYEDETLKRISNSKKYNV